MVLLKRRRFIFIGLTAGVIVLAILLSIALKGDEAAAVSFDWKSDWAVETGFNITADADDFNLPTAIAFVPNPGTSPNDPLYYVTELNGRVRVVSNDRTISTFADDFFSLRADPIPAKLEQESGMAGICLSPKHGYVFVTFSYLDAGNVLRNNIVRFQTTPKSFSLTPSAMVDFTEVFDSYRTAVSHQIGPCKVQEDLLYVNVADGRQIPQSQNIDSLLGKVLRMTLDGKPLPDNPFYQDNDIESARNFVWAYGLRNPFGLEIQGNDIFLADNGSSIDRFLWVEKGTNYLWDGTNESIGTNADGVFFPGAGVAQMEHYPPGSGIFPDNFENKLFLTRTGSPSFINNGYPAIWTVPFDSVQKNLNGVSRPIIQYRGQQIQLLSALSFGPDGLYFAPLLPNQEGFNGIYKLSYEPTAGYPNTLAAELNPAVLLNSRGCLSCHSLAENQNGRVGPVLDRDVLLPHISDRLNSSDYIAAVNQLDQSEQEPFRSFKDARREVLEADGIEQIRKWVYYQILEPRFDNPDTMMPQLNLSEPQANAIANFLTGSSEPKSPSAAAVEINRSLKGRTSDVVTDFSNWVENKLPTATRANAKKYSAALFGVGLLIGVAGTAIIIWLGIRWRISRQKPTQTL